jgi:hypothetical protein
MERRVPDITKIKNLTGYSNTHDLDSILTKVVDYEKNRLAS